MIRIYQDAHNFVDYEIAVEDSICVYSQRGSYTYFNLFFVGSSLSDNDRINFTPTYNDVQGSTDSQYIRDIGVLTGNHQYDGIFSLGVQGMFLAITVPQGASALYDATPASNISYTNPTVLSEVYNYFSTPHTHGEGVVTLTLTAPGETLTFTSRDKQTAKTVFIDRDVNIIFD